MQNETETGCLSALISMGCLIIFWVLGIMIGAAITVAIGTASLRLIGVEL